MATTQLHEYNTIYIVPSDQDQEKLDAVNKKYVQIIEKNGGSLLRLEPWGKKRLAYDIAHHSKGYYVELRFAAPPTLVTELERNLRIDDLILRHLTVRLGENIDTETRKKEIEKEGPSLMARHTEEERGPERGPRDEGQGARRFRESAKREEAGAEEEQAAGEKTAEKAETKKPAEAKSDEGVKPEEQLSPDAEAKASSPDDEGEGGES